MGGREGEPVELRSPAGDLEATFALDHGFACVSLRHRGDELLTREEAIADPALRRAMVGIPLLHPWANRLASDRFTFAGREARVPADAPFVPRDGHGLAIHGLLAPPGAWRATTSPAGDALRAQLDVEPGGPRFAAFPFEHRVAVDATLADGALTLGVAVTGTAGVRVPIAFGFHPYLRLPGSPRRRWRVTLPAAARLEVSAAGIPIGAAHPEPARTIDLADRMVDEGFVGLDEGAQLSVADGERALAVRFDAGFPAAQVYAPPTADFVCFEPMTAPANALVTGAGLPSIGPGETYVARCSVVVAA